MNFDHLAWRALTKTGRFGLAGFRWHCKFASALLATWLALNTAALADTIVEVSVSDSASNPQVGLSVHAFDGSTDIGESAVTDATGSALLSLPDGSYRFLIDKNGTEFYTGAANHCSTPSCTSVTHVIPEDVLVTVTSSAGGPEAGLSVYAFDGTVYGAKSLTDAAGVATFTLLEGSYRFLIVKNGTEFYTNSANHCTLPGCTEVAYEIPEDVTVSVSSSAGAPEPLLSVHAFSSATYSGKSVSTDANGNATFTLLPGDYRFRIDKNGTEFFTDVVNHCSVPGCTAASMEIPEDILVSVSNSSGGPEPGLHVHAFDGETFTGRSTYTDGNGIATFTLPAGGYRFRIDKNGLQFYTDSVNHCAVPGCTSVSYEVPESLVVHVGNITGSGEAGLSVYVFDGSSYIGKSGVTDPKGDVPFVLPPGNYRFRIDKDGSQYFTDTINHCAVPGCTYLSYQIPPPLSFYVIDPNLGACLENAASANGWTSPADVTSLNCDAMGISNVSGLQSFQNLSSLSLAGNPITLLNALSGLTGLTSLNLSGVDSLECGQLGELTASLGTGVITEPASCLGEGEQVFSVANPGAPDSNQFGFSIASTSLGDLVSSAITYNPVTDSFDGRVYLIDGTSGQALLELQNPSPSGSDFFGWSVAATPDNDIVVGAWQDHAGGLTAGAVHLFDGADGSLLKTIPNPYPSTDERFGFAIAVTLDGRIAIGDPQEAGGGAVHLYNASGNLLETLSNPSGDSNAEFGRALALAFSGELIVGAPKQDVLTETDAGSVHVYEDIGKMVPLFSIDNPAPGALDDYGSTVAAGTTGDILVSARYRDNHAANDGSIFVHDGLTGALRWSLANPVADENGLFGTALAGTPQGHVVIGAANDDTGASNAGRVFVFDSLDGGLLKVIDNPEPSPNVNFGQALAVTPYGQIAVGAFGADGGYGRLYLFSSVANGEALTLLSDLAFPDSNLQACVLSQAAAHGWATVNEMNALSCANSGIVDVSGLEVLTALTLLDLSGNTAIPCSDLESLEQALPGTVVTPPDPCDLTGGLIGDAVESLYNAEGERVAKTVNDDSATTVHFIYDQEGRLIAEMDAATGATLREYIYLNGQQIALVDDTGTLDEAVYFVHNDHLGTPQKITDQLQAVVWAADYEPFGEADVIVSTIENNIRFPGQYEDVETGLNYNYFRDYDPGMGRYIESDSIGLSGGLNTYAYVMGNPIRHTDSTGQIIDTALDAGFALYDLYRIVRDNILDDCDNLGENLAALGADLAAIVIPGATGAGVGVRTAKSAGRGKNKLVPDPEAVGPHSTYKTGSDGKTSNYATYEQNSHNPTGFQATKRVDVTGRAHRNPDGTIVPTPHVKEAGTRGVRPARPEELP